MDPIRMAGLGGLGGINPTKTDELPLNRGDRAQNKGAVPFADLLNDRLKEQPVKNNINNELKFSAHAQTRLNSREIELGPQDMLKLQEAVAKVREKGSRESLVLMDSAAFIVSVKNNTVITAMSKEALKENVFTNIDSTIMV